MDFVVDEAEQPALLALSVEAQMMQQLVAGSKSSQVDQDSPGETS